MKNVMMIGAVVCIALASTAASAWGFSKPSAPSAGGGATPAQVDRFIADTAAADDLIQASSLHLLKAVGTKEQVDEITAKLAAANAISDPKEKAAKLQSAQDDINADLKKADYTKANEALKQEKDAAKNESVRAGIFNFALGSLKDADLVAAGKTLVSGPPSPAVADRMPAVKDSVARLANQADGMTEIVSNAKSLMTTVGLKALPASSAESPMAAKAD